MSISPPDKLRCEYLENPIGIDIQNPRFFWTLNHRERKQSQTAYQILVSSDKALLMQEKGDAWDSGKVASEQTIQIEYAGKILESGKRYFWRVRWWDKNDHSSPYSEIAFFEMGFLNDSDWQAKWISKQDVKEFKVKGAIILGNDVGEYLQAQAIYLRKEFKVKEKIMRARAYVCGLGYYELRLNGQKIGDRVLEPAQTDYRKSALYSTYDITEAIQRDNAIGVILGNGRHVKIYDYGKPRLILQIHIEYEDGTTEKIVTDEKWKVSHGPLMDNGLYYGEKYDARLEMPGWDQPDSDDSDWDSAILVDGYNLASEMMPPIRVTQILKPQNLSSPSPGTYIFDFGQNFTGWARLSVLGPAGTEVKLRYAELLHPDGTLNTIPNQRAEATDVYILKGEGVEIYEPRFTYHGFRYVEVTGFPGVPTLENIAGCFVHSAVEPAGDFICSNQLFNQIHRNVRWGNLSNLMSVPTDCPQRDERYGWMGDAHLAAEQAIFNFDMAAFYSKFACDMQLSQLENGSLPDTVPPYLGKLVYPADPAWGTAYIIIVWYLYHYYGDTRILENHYETMKKYVQFLQANSEDHIIKKLGKYGDWCPPGSIAPKRTKLELTSTWYYYYETVLLSKMAQVIGKESEASEYASLAEAVKDAFNRHYFENDQYAGHWMSPVARNVDQTSNVLPLYLDMTPDGMKPKVLAKLLQSIIQDQDYHLDTGIIGTRYLLDVLTENGHEEIAYRIATQETYPGWGYMIAEGTTTLWERWEKITGGGMNSHNHIMLGSVDAWFYRAIAGISCLEPGWKKVKIKPGVVGDLKFATAKLKTVRGDVHVSWEKKENSLEVIVQIPVGTTAEVHLPLLWEHGVIRESGRIVWEKGEIKDSYADVSWSGRKNNYLVFNVMSGFFIFKVEK
ncbi:glycoside hydrolase family 78 protein [candidate division KSB1 bacterium]|nr:glycoside hydrolase family 78 protein [candidate division KSB1 bacterium]